LHQGRQLPAELIILQGELGAGEHGAWLNSRGLKSGVAALIASGQTGLKTRRVPLPTFVSKKLKHLYEKANVKKGCPDLVIWNTTTKSIRLVEVKCHDWDMGSDFWGRILIRAWRRNTDSALPFDIPSNHHALQPHLKREL
jgi:VRR-NUC domain